MKAKQLPFKTPQIIGYQSYAFPLGIVANYDNCLPWFYSYYIQLRCVSNFIERRDLWFDFLDGNVFGGIPCLDYDFYTKEDFSYNYDNLVDQIIESIGKDSYIYTSVDLFYIPKTIPYQQTHYSHDILVLGYNLHDSSLTIGHFNNKGLFDIYNIPMIDFYSAFISSGFPICNEQNLVILLKMKDKNHIYNLDVNHIKKMLTDYISSKEPSSMAGMDFAFKNKFHSDQALRCMSEYYDSNITKMKRDRIYGITVYDYLLQYIECLPGYSEIDFDIRPIHILWEHKKCMVMRIHFMHQCGYLDNKADLLLETFSQIEQKAIALRNTGIKYYFTKNNQLLGCMKLSLEEMRINEHKAVTSLVNSVSTAAEWKLIC